MTVSKQIVLTGDWNVITEELGPECQHILADKFQN